MNTATEPSMVSIITPAYNSEKFIADTIESVLNQSYENWEMIIVDDVSTDNTVSIVKKYMKRDDRIKLILLEKNGGAGMARNRAIEEAKGRYIAFLDSDDLWVEDKLEIQIGFMKIENHPFTFSAYEIISEEGEYFTTFSPPHKVSYNDLLKTCSIGCLTVIYDTAFFGKIYMPDILKSQDYALWLNLLKKVDHAYALPKPLSRYRIVKTSISRNKVKKLYYAWRVYREVEKLNIFQSAYYLSCYAYYGYMKNKQNS